MKTHAYLGAFGLLALLAQPPCTKSEPPSAKDQMEGKLVFSEGQFDDAKKYKTGDEFQKANKVTDKITPAVPGVHLAYYSAFDEPLRAKQYMIEVFDRSEGGAAPVHVDWRDATDTTTQVTGGWQFDIPTWPPPTDPEKLMENDVWIKPGHQYEVVIMKPLARGTFTVGGEMQFEATPTPTPVAKGKKHK